MQRADAMKTLRGAVVLGVLCLLGAGSVRAQGEGRAELARVAYNRLAKEPGIAATTLLRYALAADAAGRPEEAKTALERVRKEMGAQPVQVAGQNVPGAAAADLLARSLKHEGQP